MLMIGRLRDATLHLAMSITKYGRHELIVDRDLLFTPACSAATLALAECASQLLHQLSTHDLQGSTLLPHKPPAPNTNDIYHKIDTMRYVKTQVLRFI